MTDIGMQAPHCQTPKMGRIAFRQSPPVGNPHNDTNITPSMKDVPDKITNVFADRVETCSASPGTMPNTSSERQPAVRGFVQRSLPKSVLLELF